MTNSFKLVSSFKPDGDQPRAIAALIQGLNKGEKCQTLLGVTGSGKTFTLANVIAAVNKPTLVISHNKTLAAQLYGEFKEFFPQNAVEYFVSYYDYYQPEAYIPSTDTYIEKDSSINDRLDRLRLSSTTSLMIRKDCLVVASVSCIYNLGSPEDYKEALVFLEKGQSVSRDDILRKLIDIQYERNDYEFIVCASRGKLPWSDNTAMGHPPKYEMGGRCSNRTADGRRANEQRYAALDAMRLTPSETSRRNGAKGNGGYAKPKIANPGNIIDCGAAGGGRMGSKLASENEAPFPEALVEFFVRSFCPACGIVLDPFCGSGTTVSVAKQWGRNFIGIDIRQSQVDLSCMRIREIKEQYGLFESA